MKYKLFIISGLILVLKGCASLSSNVRKGVHTGDTEAQVEKTLGEPNEFQSDSTNGAISYLIYKKSGDICAIAIKNKLVISTACIEDPNYVSTGKKIARGFGSALQGAGEGMQNASRAPTSTSNIQKPIFCSTNMVGNSAYTTCY